MPAFFYHLRSELTPAFLQETPDFHADLFVLWRAEEAAMGHRFKDMQMRLNARTT